MNIALPAFFLLLLVIPGFIFHRAFEKVENSRIRKWGDSLEGWKWWAWQIVGGTITVIICEFFLNMIGYSMLPWKW